MPYPVHQITEKYECNYVQTRNNYFSIYSGKKLNLRSHVIFNAFFYICALEFVFPLTLNFMTEKLRFVNMLSKISSTMTYLSIYTTVFFLVFHIFVVSFFSTLFYIPRARSIRSLSQFPDIYFTNKRSVLFGSCHQPI